MILIWKNSRTGEMIIDRPQRVRLVDGSTRTNADITDSDLAAAGWQQVEYNPPESQDPSQQNSEQ